jgi:hypothetical protein
MCAERVARVRIPPSPPYSLGCRETWLYSSENRSKTPQFCDARLETGLERVSFFIAVRQHCGLFLWRADKQSGFIASIRRMQCDHKPFTRQECLDFTPPTSQPSSAISVSVRLGVVQAEIFICSTCFGSG